jgi:molybdopterin-guanine dinucleotide biosynthesis protein A
MAAVEAAQHEICIVLPVDCLLMTPEVVCALVDSVAVPDSGPLSGAYSKAMLPRLERRVSRGEPSLRGVNDSVLCVPSELLVNVNRPGQLARLNDVD